MTTYLGTALSPMIPVAGAVTEEVQTEDRSALDVNLAGRRTVYIDPPSVPELRQWAITLGYRDPSALSTLEELRSLRTSLHMVTDYAARENVLTPAASVGPIGWHNAEAGGPVAVESLWEERCDSEVSTIAATSIHSLSGGNAWSPLFRVVPGIPVSVTVNARALSGQTGLVRLDWMDLGEAQNAAPKEIGARVNFTATTAPLPLLRLTATPPPDVHVARLRFFETDQVARPAVTWTEEPQPYRPGAGATDVYVQPVSKQGVLASSSLVFSQYDYTVVEVSP